MTTRALPIFAWRKPIAPAVISAIFTAIIMAPLTFVIVFGLLPTFWGGQHDGILVEVAYAWDITGTFASNLVIDALRPQIDFLPASWHNGDWIKRLREAGIFQDYLIRLGATAAATLWMAIAFGIRRYRLTDRFQGFEYVAGPRLWEGHQAIRRAAGAMAAEDRPTKGGVHLATNLLLSRTRESLSFALFGGQGSGKTAVLKFLLAQLIDRPQTKLIVLDQKGDLTAAWPSDSVIFFAPHDARSHAWDIGADVVGEAAAQEFAAALIDTDGADSVWPQGARQIAEAVIIALQRRHGTAWGFDDLLAAFQTPPEALRALVEPVRPDVLTFLGLDDSGDFTRTSIGYITNLQAAAIPLLRPLALSWGQAPPQRRVSLKAWLHDTGPAAQTLILQNNTDFPSVSAAWMRQVIQRLVRISGSSSFPEAGDRRLWFILDEFPQLGCMPDLLKVPETHRSKGVTLLVTAQSISQIYDAYSPAQADTLINLLQTKIVLKAGQGSDLVERLNRWLGQLRWRDPAESGLTETGARKSIQEHADDLITPDYVMTLGKTPNGIEGLVIGLGPDAYRLVWPLPAWPTQRPAVRLAPWAQS